MQAPLWWFCDAAPPVIAHHREVLGITHLVTGAAIGAGVHARGPRTAGVLASHVLLDFIGHDDETVSPLVQGALAIGALGVLARTWGLRSSAMAGALTSAFPDLEVAADLAVGRRAPGYLFPSHWQLGRTRGTHPYRMPGRGIDIGVEIAVATGALAVLAVLGRHRQRAG